jgi:hypothetical protein
MKELSLWTRALERARRARLKARKKKPSQGKSLLSEKKPTSGSRESAAVHYARMSLLSFSDDTEMGDNDPAVARTVETLSVVGSDVPTSAQEKETRSSGGIPSR